MRMRLDELIVRSNLSCIHEGSRKVEQGCGIGLPPEGCKSRLGTFTREPSWERASCRLPTLFYYLLFRWTCAGRRIISETIGHYGKPVPVVYAYLRTVLERKSNGDFIEIFIWLKLKIKESELLLSDVFEIFFFETTDWLNNLYRSRKLLNRLKCLSKS